MVSDLISFFRMTFFNFIFRHANDGVVNVKSQKGSNPIDFPLSLEQSSIESSLITLPLIKPGHIYNLGTIRGIAHTESTLRGDEMTKEQISKMKCAWMNMARILQALQSHPIS
jgi:hypothetical protein